jgi:hypothetical protein
MRGCSCAEPDRSGCPLSLGHWPSNVSSRSSGKRKRPPVPHQAWHQGQNKDRQGQAEKPFSHCTKEATSSSVCHIHDETPKRWRQFAAGPRRAMQFSIGDQVKLAFEAPQDLPPHLTALVSQIDSNRAAHRTACDALQHQRQPKRHRHVEGIGAGCSLVELGGDVSPRSALAVICRQIADQCIRSWRKRSPQRRWSGSSWRQASGNRSRQTVSAIGFAINATRRS